MKTFEKKLRCLLLSLSLFLVSSACGARRPSSREKGKMENWKEEEGKREKGKGESLRFFSLSLIFEWLGGYYSGLSGLI